MPDRYIRVLLVDDDEDDFVLTRDLLSDISDWTFDVEWASGYEEALTAIQRCEHDVYLLDYRLGDRNGLELLRQAIALGCRAPLILMTGQGDRAIDLEAMKAGAADYLVKGQISAHMLERSIRYTVERAQTLQRLRDSEERLRTVITSLPVTLFVVDRNGIITLSEGRSLTSLGVQPGQLVGQSQSDIYPDPQAFQARFQQALAGEVVTFTVEMQGVVFESWYSPIQDDQGNISGVIGVATDITQRTEAERALRENEEQLRLAIDAAQMGTWDWNIRTNEFSYGGYLDRLFGIQPETFGGTFEAFADLVEASDRVHFKQAVDNAVQSGASYQTEFRVRVNGLSRWMLAQGKAYQDAAGQAFRMIGVIQDITQRKQAEMRVVTLQELTASLSKAITPAQVARVSVEHIASALGASAGNMMLLQEDKTTLQMAYHFGFAPELIEDWLNFPIDRHAPMVDAITQGQPIWMGNLRELGQTYPELKAWESTQFAAGLTVPMQIEGRALGGIGLSFNESREFSEEDRTLALAMAQQSAQAMERARLYEAERRARNTAEMAQQRLKFLAEASSLLASSLDYETTLDSVAQLAVPAIADWCTVYIVQDDGTVEQLAVAHHDPAKVAWALDFQQRFPADPITLRSIPEVLRTGEPQFYPEVTENLLIVAARDDEHMQMMKEIGFTSAMIVPLVSGERILGVITFVSAESGRWYKPSEDLSLAQELAQRASVAIEKARLYREVNEQRNLAEALRDTAMALNSSLSLSEVMEKMLDNIGRVIPHDSANIMLIEDNKIARVARSRGYVEPELEDGLNNLRLSIEDTVILRSMCESQMPLVIPDTRRSDDWLDMLGGAALLSYAGVPIMGRGKVIGFLNLGSLQVNYFTTNHAERLQAFSAQAAVAIQNAQLYEQAQELATLHERQRLARDLHDAVSQTLFSSSVLSEALPRLGKNNPDKIWGHLEQLHRLNRGAFAEMRNLLLELRPASLQETDIHDLLQQLAYAAMGRKQFEVTLEVDGKPTLPMEVKITLYRIAQEALNNIVKHAQASKVQITLHDEPHQITLRLKDNGLGFDPARLTPGMGLGIMPERARAINAEYELNSAKGSGTEIVVRWLKQTEALAVPAKNGRA